MAPTITMTPSVPELDPEWVRLVEPIVPKIPQGSTSVIPIEAARKSMGELDAAKVQALDISMADLKEGLEITNIKVAMRDGVEREMRIFKPKDAVSVPVYLG